MQKIKTHLSGWYSVILIVLLCTSAAERIHAGALDRWNDRSITNMGPVYFNFRGVAYGNQTFVAVVGGAPGGGGSADVWTSTDGGQWSPRASGLILSLEGITFANGNFIAVGNGVVQRSADGVSWTRFLAPTGLRAVASGVGTQTGTHVTVGDFGAIYTLNGSFVGTTVTPLSSDTLTGVTYGAGRFVAVGEFGRTLSSINGYNWTTNPPVGMFNPSFRAVGYGNGAFVAVGDFGAIYRSTNGMAWTDVSPGAFATFRGITHAEGMFVAVGDSETIYSSPDGMIWTQRHSSFFNPLHGVAYGNGTFVTVGDSSTILQSGVLNGRPEIVQEPQSLTASPGDYASFGVAAVGVPTLQYQWFKYGVAVTGATNSIFTLAKVTTNDAAVYTVRVGNGIGFATSLPATLTLQTGAPLDYWRWRNPLPQGNDILDIIYANGTFAGLTLDGTVGFSPDGNELTGISFPPGSQFLNLSYANGLYFVASYTNEGFQSPSTIILSATSANGVDWKLSSISNAFPYYFNPPSSGVAYGNGVYVRSGQVSLDGMTWQNNSSQFSSVVFAQGTFVAASSFYGQSLISLDGLNWTAINTPSLALMSVTFGNGIFTGVGYGGVATSPDGLHWTRRNSGTDGSLTKVTWANGRFVAVGESGAIITSVNGINWVPADTAAFSDATLVSVAGGGGRFIAVGKDGIILISTNGLNWTRRDQTASRQPLYSAASGNNTCVAVGFYGTILTSSDGTNWAAQNSGTTLPLIKVIFAQGQFVAVGSSGTILTSPNGTNWTARNSHTLAGLNGIACANGTFVVVGNGTMLTSPDAASWSILREGDLLNDITCVSNTFVAVGNNGLILNSTNLSRWVTNFANTTASLYAVTYGNGRLVAVGAGRTILYSYSSDCCWNLAQFDFNSNFGGDLFDVTYANGEFVAVGGVPYGGVPASVFTSRDGYFWTGRATRCYQILNGITYARNRFIAVGGNGAILQSGLFTDLALKIQIVPDPFFPESKSVELTVEGTPGRNYEIQSRSDLDFSGPFGFWNFERSLQLTNSPQKVYLPFFPSAFPPFDQKRFYRAREMTFP